MPVYVYECLTCGERQDAYRSIAERHNAPECPCGGKTEQRIVPANIAPILGGGAMPGYKCPVSGEFVTSRKRRKEIMAEHNLIEKG